MKKVKKDAICLKLFGYLKVLNILMDPNGTVGHLSSILDRGDYCRRACGHCLVWRRRFGHGQKTEFFPFSVCLFVFFAFISQLFSGVGKRWN